MTDLKKLMDAGYRTVGVGLSNSERIHSNKSANHPYSQLIHATTRRELVKIKTFSEAKVDKVKTAVDNLLVI